MSYIEGYLRTTLNSLDLIVVHKQYDEVNCTRVKNQDTG